MNTKDMAELMAVACRYFEGMADGNENLLRDAFDPEARFQGFRDGEPFRRGLDEFVAMASDAAQKAPMEWSGADWNVALVDQTGDVAILKITDWYRGRLYTDYLTLLCNKGKWQIINKTFWCHPEGTGA